MDGKSWPTCDAWVGLEVPESADCLLPAGHEGPHEGELHGSVRGHRDQYEHVFVKVVWPARIDGPGCSNG